MIVVCVTQKNAPWLAQFRVVVVVVALAVLELCCRAGSAAPFSSQAKTADPPAAGAAIEIREGLALEGLNRQRRTIIGVDPVAAQVASGSWAMPQAGDVVTLAPGQTRRWELVKAGKDGSFSRGASRGYLASTINSDSDRVMVLEASGHVMVYADNEPRAGDVYETGYVKIPVRLHKGPNALLFQASRLKARLTVPEASAFFNTADVTAPDLFANEPANTVAAVVVVNASESWRDDLVIVSTLPDGPDTYTTLPTLAPLSVRKVGFEIKGPAPDRTGRVPFT